MRADVPVGAFLSGGIDSTACVALAREVNPDIRTFTAAMALPGYCELAEAASTAAELGVANHPVEVTAQMVMDELPRIVWHLDDPVADPALVPLYFVARAAGGQVTVALSGEGADELFAGYPIYREPLSLRPVSALPEALRRGLARLARVLPRGVKGRGFLDRATTPIEERYCGNARIFGEPEKRRVLRGVGTPAPYTELTGPLYAEVAGLPDPTRMQHLDLHTWLRGDILVKADRMSMAHSLEVRVPFLDYRVFEVAAGIPVELSLPGRSRQTKVALRRALAGVVPPGVVHRPKLGFPTPTRVWLAGPMYPWARDILAGSGAGGLIDLDYVLGLLDEHRAGTADRSREVWTVLVFCLWYAIFVDGSHRMTASLDRDARRPAADHRPPWPPDEPAARIPSTTVAARPAPSPPGEKPA
jgi:asparagine synthase (glutamine-hydrolysing)